MKTKKSYGKKSDTAMRTWIDMSRAFRNIRARETAFIESRGLTLDQFGVLEALYHMGTLSVGELTRLVLSTPGNMTVVVRNLKEKALISSEQDSEDRRVIKLTVTKGGAELIEQIFPVHAGNMAEYFSCLTDDELTEMSSIMRRLEKANRRKS
ncbi:MAG: MarR family winged helix-turn-helix transcriptional regulator [Deferribacterales bacterium]